jgi:hypothetical protein
MRLVQIAIATSLATPAFADDFPIRLADGATRTITAEHTRKSNVPAPAPNWRLTTVKRLTWHVGKSGGPPALTVTPVSATPGAGSPPEVAQARSLAIPATLSVDEHLEPGDFVDGDKVRAEFVRLVPNAKGADTKLIDASTKAMVATELFMTAHGQGLTLKPGAEISADVPIANPLGGPPVRGVVIAKLEAVDKAAGSARIKWSQTLDPASFKAVVETMVADLGRGQLPPDRLAQMRAALEGAAYDSRTECRFDIDIRSGLARRAECTAINNLTIQGKTQQVSDTWLITQSPPDKA